MLIEFSQKKMQNFLYSCLTQAVREEAATLKEELINDYYFKNPTNELIDYVRIKIFLMSCTYTIFFL